MTKQNNNIRVALITTKIPVAEDLENKSNILFQKLMDRERNVVVDIYSWNLDNIPHKQSVLSAERLECGLTILRVPYIYKLLDIKYFAIHKIIINHIVNTYDKIWINGDGIEKLISLFPDKQIVTTSL